MKINRPHIQTLFRLAFVHAAQTGIVLIGGDRCSARPTWRLLWATPPAMNGHSVLFTTAVDIINTTGGGPSRRPLKHGEFRRYLEARHTDCRRARLPADRQNRRRSALPDHQPSATNARRSAIYTNRAAYKHWSQIFNNDSTLASAILDRVLHHADTVIIEGQELPHERRT